MNTSLASAGALERAQGCLLGQLAGDSLGALVEFQDAEGIQARYPDGLRELGSGGPWNIYPGQPTDDSELALALARSLVRRGGYDVEDVASSYVCWLESGPFDVGTTTWSALSAGRRSRALGRPVSDACKSAANIRSEANGALMRVSPLGIYGARLEADQVRDAAMEDASLTHPNSRCQAASGIFASVIAAVIGDGLDPREAHRTALAWADAWCIDGRVRTVLMDSEHEPPKDFKSQQGWVLIALQNAFYQMLHATSLEEGIVATVMAGGDTDTNGCIAGALLGAVHGRNAVPQRWQDTLATCRPLAGMPGVHQPRPAQYWPVDAAELAGALLLGS